MNGGFVYVASPYTRYAGGLEEAFTLACRETARLIAAGIPAYSPIAHSHSVAIRGGLDPLDWHLWMRTNAAMIDAAAALVVICAEGWRESAGVQAEIDAFGRAQKVMFLFDVGVQSPERMAELLFSTRSRVK